MLANFEYFLRSVSDIFISFRDYLDHFFMWFDSNYPYTLRFIGITLSLLFVSLPFILATIETFNKH